MTRIAPFAIILALAGSAAAHGQADVAAQKAVSPDQKHAEVVYARYDADRVGLKATAQKALAAENAREIAGDCPVAQSTYDWEVCLNAQSVTTRQNYAALAGAIRAMLGLHEPALPGEVKTPIPGLEGYAPTPEQDVASFDRIESESKIYRDHASKIAFQQMQGGSGAPVFELETGQKLLRMHMKELAFVYGLLPTG